MSNPVPKKPKITLLQYYMGVHIELVTEQRKLYPFAFGLIDAPSDEVENDAFNDYFEIEAQIQKTRNEILKLKGI